MSISVDDDVLFFFFFQAEDGIRDYKVTGVQTCALPIYYARTRAALLSLTFARILELDQVLAPSGGLAESIAGYVFEALGAGRARMLARYEFALEATRRPELRAEYDSGGALIRRLATEALAAAGSTDPTRPATL